MSTMIVEDLVGIEALRMNLQQQIEKLRESLRYWQTWEAEYDGFREEIQANTGDLDPDDVLTLGRDFGGHVVTEEEIKDLIAYARPRRRTQKETVAAIAGRINTAQMNIEAITKRLEPLETRLEELNNLDSQSTVNEQEAPVLEIHEELDEFDNVISSKLVNADKTAQQLGHALQIASAKTTNKGDSLMLNTSTENSAERIDSVMPNPKERPGTFKSLDDLTNTKKHSLEQSGDLVGDKESPPNAARGGSSWETNETHFHGAHGSANGMSNIRLPEFDDKFLELDENDQIIGSRPISHVPLTFDERVTHQREVLENAQAIGPIVATMDIEEDSDYTDDEHDEDEEDYDSEVDDADDVNFGKNSARSVLTTEYITEMEELMKKYQPVMLNVGPQDAGFPAATPFNKLPTPLAEESNTRSGEQGMVKSTAGKEKDGTIRYPDKSEKTSKGVRFADQLEISTMDETLVSETPSYPQVTSPIARSANTPATLSDVVERRPRNESIPPGQMPIKAKKVSRFKATRIGN